MSFFFKRWPKRISDETIDTLNTAIPKYHIDRSEFIHLNFIAGTQQSTVNLVRHQSSKKEYIEKTILHVENDENSFFREVMILASNLSPLLASLYGYDYIKIKNKQTGKDEITGYIYMYKLGELGKSLEDYINDHLLNVTEKTIIAYGVAYALSILHENNIMYRDLKPSNILLDENKYPILIDFGICMRIKNDKLKPYGEVGTKLYCPPEQTDGSEYSYKVDNFSYGKLLYFLGLEQDPKEGYLDENEINDAPQFSKDMKKIIGKLNSPKPKNRYSFDYIYEKILVGHAYFIDPKGKDKLDSTQIDDYNIYLEDIHTNLSGIQETECNSTFTETKFTEYQAKILVQRMYQDLLLRSPKMTPTRAKAYSNFITYIYKVIWKQLSIELLRNYT